MHNAKTTEFAKGTMYTQGYENQITREGRDLRASRRTSTGEFVVWVRTFEESYAILRTFDVAEARAHWKKMDANLRASGFAS